MPFFPEFPIDAMQYIVANEYDGVHMNLFQAPFEDIKTILLEKYGVTTAMYMGVLMEIQDIWRQIDNYGTWQGEPFSQELAHEKFIEFDSHINSHRDHLTQEDLNELDRMAEEQDRYEVEEHDEMARALGWNNYHHMMSGEDEEDRNTVEVEAPPSTPPSASAIAPLPSPPAIIRDTSMIPQLEPIPRDEMDSPFEIDLSDFPDLDFGDNNNQSVRRQLTFDDLVDDSQSFQANLDEDHPFLTM